MEGVLSPRESGRLIAENSQDVKVKPAGVTKVAKVMQELVKKNEYSIKSWKEHELNPKTMDKAALNWVFLADTLNFSFWSADETKKFKVKYNNKEHTGYWSLCAAMNRALDDGMEYYSRVTKCGCDWRNVAYGISGQPSSKTATTLLQPYTNINFLLQARQVFKQLKGIPLTDANYYASISREDLANVFRSDSEYEMPLLDERLAVLHEAGKTLLQKYGGSFANVIAQCGNSAQSLLKLVVTDFPSYRDEAEYKGKKVAIYKRAQILIADIWACFEGQGYGEFHDIDTITMFADYRIPQALMYFGALEYSEELLEYLRKEHLMKSGDRYELEIRGCSIWATELICQEASQLLAADPDTKDKLINSILIDHYLWDFRREKAVEMKDLPFHRIRCIYY